MSTRITKDQRERIARKAIEKSYENKVKDFAKLEEKLATECYNAVFPKKIRDIIANVPDGWLRKCKCLKFNVGGWTVDLCIGKEVPTPAMDYCKPIGTIPAGELCDKVQKFSQDKKTQREQSNQDYYKMVSFLESFSSYKVLREKWPEGADFYNQYDVDAPKASVPVTIISDINKMLGIKETKSKGA